MRINKIKRVMIKLKDDFLAIPIFKCLCIMRHQDLEDPSLYLSLSPLLCGTRFLSNSCVTQLFVRSIFILTPFPVLSCEPLIFQAQYCICRTFLLSFFFLLFGFWVYFFQAEHLFFLLIVPFLYICFLL